MRSFLNVQRLIRSAKRRCNYDVLVKGTASPSTRHLSFTDKANYSTTATRDGHMKHPIRKPANKSTSVPRCRPMTRLACKLLDTAAVPPHDRNMKHPNRKPAHTSTSVPRCRPITIQICKPLDSATAPHVRLRKRSIGQILDDFEEAVVIKGKPVSKKHKTDLSDSLQDAFYLTDGESESECDKSADDIFKISTPGNQGYQEPA